MDNKKKLQIKLAKIEKKETKKRKKWHMFNDPYCSKCSKSGTYIETTDYGICSGYDKIRCDCSLEYTKRYKKARKNKDISVKKYKKKLKKFYDNNSNCESHYHNTDRSW